MNPIEQQNAAEELTGIYIDLESQIMQKQRFSVYLQRIGAM